MPVTKIKSKWDSGNLEFYQSTAANSAGIVFGDDSDDFLIRFNGTNHDESGTVSGTQTGYIEVNINGTTLFIPCYPEVE